MKKLLIAAFVAVPLIGCTQEKIVRRQVPAPETTEEATPEETPGEPDPNKPGETEKPPPGTTVSEDKCLDGQDMNAADVDISACPAIPNIPGDVKVGGKSVSLGAWEIGTTKDGEAYKYGTLTAPDASGVRELEYDGGKVAVNKENLECWAKGYYRLRKILQNPPAEWVTLKDKGFQYRFFQFQTDLRNGPTGYTKIASFQDHLVKWVTVIDKKGVCDQTTLAEFTAYAKSELARRGIAAPTN